MIKSVGIALVCAATLLASPCFARITCYAHSRTAYGYGYSPSRAVAIRIALSQCAIRTPRGLVCRITSCT
jgi:hypothetical protein